MIETWKAVVGYEGLYEVSDHGRVRNSRNGALKSQNKDKEDNRMRVMLYREGKQKCAKVHRLVLIAFVGPNPLGYECCHNDGNPQNNMLRNLRWDTAANNQADRAKHGTSNRGEQCAAAKLTEAQALAIINDPRKQKIIAAEYGILQNAVSRIKSGKRWAHLHKAQG